MLKKKRGFTLTELLVVILISTIVFAAVGGSLFFVSNMTNKLIAEAKDINMAKNIEKYVRESSNMGENVLSLKLINGELQTDNEEVVFSNTGLTDFKIYRDDKGFLRCFLDFEHSKFDFIIYITKGGNDE